MRPSLPLLLLLPLLLSPFISCAPTMTLGQTAQRTGKPLLLYFHAPWCSACRYFETEILPAPALRPLLDQVAMQSYDTEEAGGKIAASRLNVHGLPTFVLLDERGLLCMNLLGTPRDPADFVEFMQKALPLAQSEQRLRQRLAAPRPEDVLDGARWHVLRWHPEEALRLYQRAAEGTGEVAADAHWEQLLLERLQSFCEPRDDPRGCAVPPGKLAPWREALLASAAAFVKARPGSEAALRALPWATVTRASLTAEAEALFASVTEANKQDPKRLRQIAYTALAAHAYPQALQAAHACTRAGAPTADGYQALAECLYYNGNPAAASAMIRLAQQRSHSKEERRLLREAGTRYEKRRGEPADIVEKLKKQMARTMAHPDQDIILQSVLPVY